jgi:hypothetical protein
MVAAFRGDFCALFDLEMTGCASCDQAGLLAGALSTAGGEKKTRLEQSGKRTRVRAHLRTATRIKQGQRDRRDP